MANARPGYKRIMGEIPEEMHEKITLYNKISERPLNVSRAIELCIQQAVKKIEDELVFSAESGGGCGMAEDEIYEEIKKDIEGHELSDIAIYEHFKALKRKNLHDEISMKMLIFPIDEVEINEFGKIIFSAKGAKCITLVNNDYLDKSFKRHKQNESKEV